MNPPCHPRHRTRTGTARARTVNLAGTLALTVLVVAGCGNRDQPDGAATNAKDTDGYHGTLVDPPLEMAPVTLRDTHGNLVRVDRLTPEKATALFFGFTNCDDVCPTTMADLASARRSLPAQVADQVELVFISVDPDRDTAPLLRTWLDQFDPDTVGLRGPTERVHRAERSLYAPESGKSVTEPTPSTPDANGDHGVHGEPGEHDDATGEHGRGGPGYEVDHTSIVYIFGPDGETIIYTGGTTVDEYAADFAQLIE